MPKERKKYALRPTRKPARNCLLSTVVRVRNEQGEDGYCHVSFDPSLIEAVGMKLPRGVAPYDPAYLMVEYDPRRQLWIVGARYLSDETGAVLWESPEKPGWLNFIPLGGKNGTHPKNKNGDTASSGADNDEGSTPGSLCHSRSPEDYFLAA